MSTPTRHAAAIVAAAAAARPTNRVRKCVNVEEHPERQGTLCRAVPARRRLSNSAGAANAVRRSVHSKAQGALGAANNHGDKQTNSNKQTNKQTGSTDSKPTRPGTFSSATTGWGSQPCMLHNCINVRTCYALSTPPLECPLHSGCFPAVPHPRHAQTMY